MNIQLVLKISILLFGLTAFSQTRSPETGLKSGRYQVKDEMKISIKADKKQIEEKPPEKLPAKTVEVKPDKKIENLAFKPSATTSSPSTTTTTTTTLVPVEAEEPSVVDQVKNLVNGDDQAVEAYIEQVHPDDIRMNRLELWVVPGLVYNSSKSNYSYRNYQTFSPDLSFGAEVWLTPFMGIYGDYTSSLGADIPGGTNSQSRIAVKHEWTELGFEVRKFFGLSRKSNSVEFGIHYSDYKFTVPSDDTTRVRLKTSGIGFHLLTRIPTAPSYSWTFGGKISPRLSHQEQATGLDLKSGGSVEAARVGLNIGGELKMSRQHQVVWELGVQTEKMQYSGAANQLDSETNLTPNGVSVTNSITTFSLGYRWGQ